MDRLWLSYNKQGLVSTNSYGGLLAYNNKGSHFDNRKFKQGLESTNGGHLGSFETQQDHAKESSHVVDGDSSAARDQFFFLEKDLHLGTKMTLHFQKCTRKGTFLPREISNQIPFSSDKVQETLQILSLDPSSKEADVVSKRIELYEQPTIEGVKKKCVTSLESMVDYVISKIESNVKALTAQAEKDSKMEYTVKGVKDDHETAVCHKTGYTYAVFFCHRTKTTRFYMVSLVGKDGTKLEAIVACHTESNDLLDNYVKKVLNIVPGSTHICHFPPAQDTVIWVPK